MSKIRYNLVLFFFVSLFSLLIARLIWFGLQGQGIEETPYPAGDLTIVRPDILDRNGKLLASDIQSFALFAQPKRIINIKETVHILHKALPKLNIKLVIKKLHSKQSFVWIERNLTAQQKSAVKSLGLPGLGFRRETHRYYINGNEAAYIVGYVNIDNKGLAGIEKYIDTQGSSQAQAQNIANKIDLSPIILSMDIRIQSVVCQVLKEAMIKYKAQAAGAIVQNVNTGEIIAMSSIPDFNPSHPQEALQPNNLNRMSSGLYEMGSVIKVFTTAMALDSGKFTPDTMVDASKPFQVGPHQFIHDFHGLYKPLSVSDVFIHSSNIGSAKEAEEIGVSKHRAFLKKIGLLSRLQAEIPEISTTVEPKKWKKVNSMTISFGHGIMFTPLQVSTSSSVLVNGGYLRSPTFLKVENKRIVPGKQVISRKTSKDLIQLLRLNMNKGSGHFANEAYYDIGGKTGTAEKVENGKYNKDKNFNSFLAAFPLRHPKYIVLTIIDAPQKVNEHEGVTAGFNAAPMAVEIINRCANFLGIHPNN